MLIIALVLAVIGLAALVTAVVTGNELIAWVCIGASAIGVLLLIVDAVRERGRRGAAGEPAPDESGTGEAEDDPAAEAADYDEAAEAADYDPAAEAADSDAEYPDAGATEVIPAVETAEPESAEESTEESTESADEAAAEEPGERR